MSDKTLDTLHRLLAENARLVEADKAREATLDPKFRGTETSHRRREYLEGRRSGPLRPLP